MSWLIVWLGVASAAPTRVMVRPSSPVLWTQGRQVDLLEVKLVEGAGLTLADGALKHPGTPESQALAELLVGGWPLFSRPGSTLRADRETFDPEHRLADLSLYMRVRSAAPESLAAELVDHPLVESVSFALAATPPPVDIAPATPDFTADQVYADAAPDGLGFHAARAWPGGDGDGITIVDVEYGWDADHEDLESSPTESAWGQDSGSWRFHGTSVLGQLIAGDNGYGVTGLVPGAEALVASPYDQRGEYNVASAIDGAASLLQAGDVILIEQQAEAFGDYAPVEVSPAVFDAIASAVARGIVVVEPGGNGGQDLDGAEWDGWFDRDIQDSGAIMVGGGASPESGYTPRAWYPSGSSYGSRIDLQGWYDGIVTTTGGDYDGYYADLFYPDGDEHQAYTSRFGGTSGASPMIAAAAGLANAVAWQVSGAPWDPMDLRDGLIQSGTPGADGADNWVGPQPDVAAFLRTYGWR